MNDHKGSVRMASHAGSWYTDKGSHLSEQLTGWLADAGEATRLGARAIIAPHAGYSYSGPCAAYAYNQIDPTNVKRIFILGPSHHKYIKGCALSKTKCYQTPLYDLVIDTTVNRELSATGHFEEMSLSTDEDEHSIEMHLPYVAQVMKSKQGSYTVVPILVGNLSYEQEQMYGRLFANYLNNPENLFVISSDFCHWGKRFCYHSHDANHGEIYQHIEHLDKTGMSLIENLKSREFHTYLESSGNTICGRHPILVLMCTIDALSTSGGKFDFKFLHYAQSNKVKSSNDSSVSYAAGSLSVF